MILYRSVGFRELELIYDAGLKAFPTDLPQQPVFYPVLQVEYARQVAADWNARPGQVAGYVTQFKLEDEYAGKYKPQPVGEGQFQELWIPAEEVAELNKHLVGLIKVTDAYVGDRFEGFIPDKFGLQGKNAADQFTQLANAYLYKRMDFYLEIKRNHKAIFLNYPFWQKHEFKNPRLKSKILQEIRDAWIAAFPKTPLPQAVLDEKPVSWPPAAAAEADEPEEESLAASTDPDPQPRLVDEDPEQFEEPDPDASEVTEFDDTEQITEPDESEAAEANEPVVERRAFAVKAIPLSRSTAKDDDAILELVAYDVEDEAPEQSQLEEPEPGGLPGEVSSTVSDSVQHSLEEPEDSPTDKEAALADEPEDPAEPEGAAAVQRHPEPKPAPSIQPPPARTTYTPREAPDAQLKRGIRLGLSGNLAESVEVLSALAKAAPLMVAAHVNLGVALHRLGEDDRALTSYETALRRESKHAEAHYFRANILYRRGSVREAIEGYRRSISLQPALIRAHVERPPEDRLVDYSPTPAELRWIAAPAQHILELNQALKADPRQPELLKERAAEYARLGNHERAIGDYSAALSVRPEDAQALHQRGLSFEATGKLDRAAEDYRQALQLNPQLPDEYIHRGVSFGQMGQFRQATASLTEGIRLAPQNPDAYFNRGVTYYEQGDFEKAIADFSKVLELAPEDETAYYWRAYTREASGQQAEAMADYERFVRLSSDPRAAEEVRRKLANWQARNPVRRSVENKSGPAEASTERNEPAEPVRTIDLHDVLDAVGERVLRSQWFASGVASVGESAAELLALADQKQPIEGAELLRITSSISQTTHGDFTAFEPGATAFWLFIHAWEGQGFYLETNDAHVKQRVTRYFPWAEAVAGAKPPFEGWLIRI